MKTKAPVGYVVLFRSEAGFYVPLQAVYPSETDAWVNYAGEIKCGRALVAKVEMPVDSAQAKADEVSRELSQIFIQGGGE